MNKRQKEVIQSQLKAEKKVLKQIEKQYTAALNDINTKLRILQSDELTQSRIYRIEHQKALKSQVSGILDKLHSEEYSTIDQFLKDSYTSGFIGTTYDLFGQGVPLILPIDPKEAVRAVMTDSKISGGLYNSLGVDVKKLKKSISAEISRGLASDMSYEDITRNIANTTKAPLSRARTIVLTETHRIKQASTRDVQVKAKEKGADVLKQWNSTLDGETRKTHRKLDGQIREVEEPFEMDGKEAMYPGDFNDPAEDCNCRCESLTRARWALGEEELATLKERAEFFGLDKTKDFEDFKGKYLKAAEDIKKNEDRQAEIRARREAYRKREAAKKKAASIEVPDFHEMKPAQIKEWLDQNIQTKFGDIKGVNKDFLAEAAKAVSVFEQKMGGKTIEGLSVKFGGLSGKNAAAYDAKTNTLSLKKTGSIAAFEESLKKDNERAFRKRHKDYHATSTYIGTVFHEIGHAVDHDTGQQLSRMLSVDPVLFVDSVNVSVYAGAEPALGAPKRSEAWAENFAVYMEGGEKAKEIPPAIVAMIEDYFQRKQ